MAAMAWKSHRSIGPAAGLASLVVAAGGLLGAVRAEPAITEVTALARAYGAGVHAYFSGDAQRAYDDLTQAIEAGTRDPRAWYFRGLAALKLGRLDEAEADFSTAAARETEAAGDWAVSRSLERVQGHDRLALERHRVRARVAGYQQRRQAVERRYSQIESRQPEMLRERRPEGITREPPAEFGGEEIPAAPLTPPPGAEALPAGDAPAEDEPAEPEAGVSEPPMAEASPEPAADPAPEAESAPDADPADPAMQDEKPMAAEGEPPAAADDPGSKVFDN